ncbi:hypothetical protein Q4595_20505, partial [Wenyingzhuangia sp. 1_MG-2023]|nr:hypothetical protein [Wenyingzhuangia sp. 1_MG-2023]
LALLSTALVRDAGFFGAGFFGAGFEDAEVALEVGLAAFEAGLAGVAFELPSVLPRAGLLGVLPVITMTIIRSVNTKIDHALAWPKHYDQKSNSRCLPLADISVAQRPGNTGCHVIDSILFLAKIRRPHASIPQ